MAVTADWYEGC